MDTYRWCMKSRSQTPPPRANEFPAMKNTSTLITYITRYNNILHDMKSISPTPF